MNQLAKRLKRILDRLPFNGSKLSIGALFIAIGQIGSLVPGLDIVELIKLILSNPTKAGIIAAVVGAVHKYLKARFPHVQY